MEDQTHKETADRIAFENKYNVPPIKKGMTITDHMERINSLKVAYAKLSEEKAIQDANNLTKYPCPNCQGCGCPTCGGYGTLSY